MNTNETDYRLFGYGNLNSYGEYMLVVANSKEMAYELLSKDNFITWKEEIYWNKEHSIFDKEGKPLNGCAYSTLKNKNNGLFEMDDKTLFSYFINNIFSTYDIVDLKTNIWNDNHA